MYWFKHWELLSVYQNKYVFKNVVDPTFKIEILSSNEKLAWLRLDDLFRTYKTKE